MTIKELIKELKKYPNQDAEINFISNTILAECDVYDEEKCDIAFMQQDIEDCPIVDIMLYKDNPCHNEECLSDLLYEHKKLTIDLDTEDEYTNICVSTEDGKVLRDIYVNGHHSAEDNIILRLREIL